MGDQVFATGCDNKRQLLIKVAVLLHHLVYEENNFKKTRTEILDDEACLFFFVLVSKST